VLSHQSFFLSHLSRDSTRGRESSNVAKLSLKEAKTDNKDAMTIAKFLMEPYEELGFSVTHRRKV
jgi:hypothetical protein